MSRTTPLYTNTQWRLLHQVTPHQSKKAKKPSSPNASVNGSFYLTCTYEPPADLTASLRQLRCPLPGHYVLIHCRAPHRIITTSNWFSAAPCTQPLFLCIPTVHHSCYPVLCRGVAGVFTGRDGPYRSITCLYDPAARV
jgi:hypothetical protein